MWGTREAIGVEKQTDGLKQVTTEGEVATEDRIERTENRTIRDCDENSGGLVAHDERVGGLGSNKVFVKTRVELIREEVRIGSGRERTWGGTLQWGKESPSRASGSRREGRQDGP